MGAHTLVPSSTIRAHRCVERWVDFFFALDTVGESYSQPPTGVNPLDAVERLECLPHIW